MPPSPSQRRRVMQPEMKPFSEVKYGERFMLLLSTKRRVYTKCRTTSFDDYATDSKDRMYAFAPDKTCEIVPGKQGDE